MSTHVKIPSKKVLHNLLQNPSTWIYSNASYDSSTGIITFQPGHTAMVQKTLIQAQPKVNHKYYGRYYCKSENGDDFTCEDGRFEWYFNDGGQLMVFGNALDISEHTKQWTKVSKIVETPSITIAPDWVLRNFIVNGNNNYYRKGFVIIDLTEEFGAGNEPTVDYMDSVLPEDYQSDYSIITDNSEWKNVTDTWVKVSSTTGEVWKHVTKLDVCHRQLNMYSWDDISKISQSGLAANYWSVGDCKEITLNGAIGSGLTLTNYTTYVYILGFNHNLSHDSSALNTIDFGTFKTTFTDGTDVCLVDSKYDSVISSGTTYFSMNNSQTSIYGWKGCRIRYHILGSTNSFGNNAGSTTATSPVANTLMAALPSDLRAVMKPMTIYTDNFGDGSDTASNVTTSVDYLPLLAEFEIFGTKKLANFYEQNYQQQYAYYANGAPTIKYQHNSMGSIAWWWERSPYCYSSDAFCRIYINGEPGASDSIFSSGVAPIFRV